MASTKVVLRTALADVFRVGDIEITHEGTELSSRTKADEVMAIAAENGVTLYEVEQPVPEAPKKEGGN